MIAASAGPKVELTGEQVFGQVCKNCHEAGLAGAPTPLAAAPPRAVDRVAADSMMGVAFEFATGYAQQFTLQLQQELMADMIFKVGYVGNVNSRLDMTFDANQPVPGPGNSARNRPFDKIAPGVGGITYNTSDSNSHYQALQTTLERRFADNLGFLLSYTWSHSIADTAGISIDPPCHLSVVM